MFSVLDPVVSLYGKPGDVCGWVDFFEQEKIPFRCGNVCGGVFSSVNVLVGLTPQNLTSQKKKLDQSIDESAVFVVEYRCGVSDSVVEIRKGGGVLCSSLNIPSSRSYSDAKRYGSVEIFRILKSVIFKALEFAELPYVQVWYYPQPYKTIFLFRQDVDYVTESDIVDLISTTSEFAIRGTYFINISGEEEFDEEIGHLRLTKPTTPYRRGVLLDLLKQNNEIANHGYWHWVFRDFYNNYRNIELCGAFLNKILNTRPKGFASPGGVWNKNLAKAIERCKLVYSCNGLRDGGLPYYPHIEGVKTKVLEIPFYFLCDASFDKPSGFRKFIPLIGSYYSELVEKNVDSGLPIAIMGHPHISGRYAKELYLPIFRRLRKLEIPNYTLGEFAHWWNKRDGIKIDSKRYDKKLTIQTSKGDVLVRVTYKGKVWFLRTDRRGLLDFDL